MKKIALLLLSAISIHASATTWLVGPSQTYTMPSQVSTLVQNGDTVLIDAGLYVSDVAKWTADDLVIKGVGGVAQLFSNGLVHSGKGIWLIQGDNAIVEHIEFAEAPVWMRTVRASGRKERTLLFAIATFMTMKTVFSAALMPIVIS